MVLTGDNRRTRQQACTSVILFTKNPTMTDLESNPVLHGEMQAGDYQSQSVTQKYRGEDKQ